MNEKRQSSKEWMLYLLELKINEHLEDFKACCEGTSFMCTDCKQSKSDISEIQDLCFFIENDILSESNIKRIINLLD